MINMGNQMNGNYSLHPCFNREAENRFGRIHLPIAPKCNIQCNFCNRKFDCVNESRPGVTSNLLTPAQALHYLQKVLPGHPEITTVGIAGPGDPFSNPEETMKMVELVNHHFPELLICLSTNGLNLLPYIGQLVQFQVSHVTVTVNAVDPVIGQRIYSWVRDQGVLRGVKAAEMLLERQITAITALKDHGFVVKINSIVIPGVNDQHIPEIAAKMAGLKADMMNCVPLFPAPDTFFENTEEPSASQMKLIRREASRFLPQMEHCRRCRADAAGLLSSPSLSASLAETLSEIAQGPLHPGEVRPCVAVASWEGLLINQHLGEAAQLIIYQLEDGEYQFLENRPAPTPGNGKERWLELSRILGDCHTILTSGAGPSPTETLASQGIKLIVTEGLIEESLSDMARGTPLRRPNQYKHSCGAVCKGAGLGCG
jgi:nitrogen fixation protein NifB